MNRSQTFIHLSYNVPCTTSLETVLLQCIHFQQNRCIDDWSGRCHLSTVTGECKNWCLNPSFLLMQHYRKKSKKKRSKKSQKESSDSSSEQSEEEEEEEQNGVLWVERSSESPGCREAKQKLLQMLLTICYVWSPPNQTPGCGAKCLKVKPFILEVPLSLFICCCRWNGVPLKCNIVSSAFGFCFK